MTNDYVNFNEYRPVTDSLIIVKYMTDDKMNHIHEIVNYKNEESLRCQLSLSKNNLMWKYKEK